MPNAASDAAGWNVPYTITGTGEKTITFKTENKFVDADARVTITTPAASAPVLDLADNTGNLSMGTAANGVYSPTATFTGTTSVADAGWTTSGTHNVSDTDVVVGKVNQSTISNGVSTIPSGSTITPGPVEQLITISEGYNTSRTLTIGSASSSTPGEVTSGTATINDLTFTENTQNGTFSVSGSSDVTAPTINTAGYVSGSIGTLNGNVGGATVVAAVPYIGLSSSFSGATSALKPTLSKQTISISGVTDAANGSATTTAPSSGAYIAIQSNANTASITAVPSVYNTGYGTSSYYNIHTQASTTVGAAQSDIYYVPIKAGAVTSGTASITSTTIAYNTSNDNFDITGSTNVSAPTFTEGYIASNVGTKNANNGGATLTSTLSKIAIQANLSGTGTKTPTITKDAATNITAAGNATTSEPSSGYYIAVSSAANTDTVQATATVTTAGYGTTTSGQYTTTPSSSLTVGAAASATTYIPIASTTFANAATSGITYSDISNTAPVLISGDFLYINEGYTPNVKISLAQLVPDATGTNASAAYILSGYTAFDNDGTLIIGTMQTYDGSYTIT